MRHLFDREESLAGPPRVRLSPAMLLVLESLMPVLAVIATGWGARATGLIPEPDWRGVERLTYFILIPAILIYTLSMSDLRQIPVASVAFVLLAPVMAMSALILAMRRPLQRIGIGGPAFTSIFQGSIRWNSFVALGLAGSLHGKSGLAYCAIAFAVLIPFANLVSLAVLGRYGAAPLPLGLRPFLGALLRNPFIWSTFCGVMIQVSGVSLPTAAVSYADVLGKAALACGLLMVGAGLDVRTLRAPGLGLAIATGVRLVVLPVMTGLLGQWAGLSGSSLAVPVICAAVPTAPAAYILAKQRGGDAPLMATIITGQTLLSALTLPILLLIFTS